VNEIIEECPYAYQLIEGREQQVNCRYVLEDNVLHFDFPEGYDDSRVLYIDPVVMASTASGSTTYNFGHSATYDLEGNIYTGGRAYGNGYPTATGSFQETFSAGVDICVSKLDPVGENLIWATYLGGAQGDLPHSMIVNDDFELSVYGNTQSSDYPVSAGAYDTTFNGANDVCVTTISADGSALIGSTFLGGTSDDGAVNGNYINYDDTFRGEIILDDVGNIYLATYTSSSDFPVTSGAYQTVFQGVQDGVVMKLPKDVSSIIWSTFIGGSSSDTAYGLRLDEDENVLCTGTTGSNDLPVTASAYQGVFGGGDGDAYLAKISADGITLMACSYFGTDQEDASFFLDVDSEGDVFIYGQSKGDIPVTAGVYGTPDGDIFVSKFDPDFSTLMASTRLFPAGGAFGYPEVPTAFLVDECNNIYLSGYYASSGFDITEDAVFDTGSFHILVMEPDMTALLYGTYYTGDHVDGGTSRFDDRGVIYQAVCNSTGFNILPDAYSPNLTNSWDVCVFKIDLELSGVVAELELDIDDQEGCAPFTVSFGNNSLNGLTYEWNFGDGNTSTDATPTHTFVDGGEYTVRLIAHNEETCNALDTAYAQVSVSVPDVSLAYDPGIVCIGQEVKFQDTSENFDDPVAQWLWDFGDGSTSTEEEPVHAYAEDGFYSVSLTITTEEGCSDTELVLDAIEVITVAAAFDADREVCIDTEVRFTDQTIVPEELLWGPPIAWEWDFGDGNTSDEQHPTHKYENTGFYDIALTVWAENGCEMVHTEEDLVEIFDVAADFEINQTELTIYSYPVVSFYNYSDGATDYQWFIDGEFLYDDKNFSHEFELIPGEHTIELIVTRDECEDNMEKTIRILDPLAPGAEGAIGVFVPNIFSPNGDGLNESFLPLGIELEDCESFEMIVFDRWGKEMFQSDDKLHGWDGMDKDETEAMPGVYVWMLKYTNAINKKTRNMNGTVTLVR
jgi:gliding motility-associated-like protein